VVSKKKDYGEESSKINSNNSSDSRSPITRKRGHTISGARVSGALI
jgi:hypothetical protein